MKFRNILTEIGKTDTGAFEESNSRRQLLKSFGAKVAVAALPIAVASLVKKASAKTTDTIADVYNLALQFKYLEYNLYHTGNNTGSLIPAAHLPGFQALENQEAAQIRFLNATITALGGVPYTPKFYNGSLHNPLFIPDAYDFTAGGTYSPFDNYPTFLVLAQIFEDLGVRAIKGEIPTVLADATNLALTMQLQSTEARHAAHVRYLRRLTGGPEYPAPWINNNIPPSIPLQSYYTGEDNTIQNNVDIMQLPDENDNGGTVPQKSATAAFDEPIDKTTALSLIAPFMK